MQGSASFLSWDAVIPPLDLLKGAVRVLALAGLFVWGLLEVITRFSSGSFTRFIIESIAKGHSDVYYAGGFVGFWLLLSYFACWLLFRKGYPVSFTVHHEGVGMTTQPRQRKINRTINTALFWLSLFAGRPGGMGTALLAEAGQSTAYNWTEISKVSLHPDRKTVKLKNNWRTLMVLYCASDNYQMTADLVLKYYKEHAAARLALHKNSPCWSKVLASLMVYPALLLAAALVWHSPLLSNPHGVVILAVAACSACASRGKLRRLSTGVLIAAVFGLMAAMALGAFEPLGDVYFRYYRYDRLERMPYMAEFIGSMIGISVFCCLAAWLSTKNNHL